MRRTELILNWQSTKNFNIIRYADKRATKYSVTKNLKMMLIDFSDFSYKSSLGSRNQVRKFDYLFFLT